MKMLQKSISSPEIRSATWEIMSWMKYNEITEIIATNSFSVIFLNAFIP